MTYSVSYYDRKGWLAIQKSPNSIVFFDIHNQHYIYEIEIKEIIIFFFFHQDTEKFSLVCASGEFFDYDINSWELLYAKVMKGKSFSEGYIFSEIQDKIFLISFNNEIDIFQKIDFQLINSRRFSFPVIDINLSLDGKIFFVGIPQNYILPCKVDLSTSGKPINLPQKIGKFFISADNNILYSLFEGIISVFSLKDTKKIYEFEIRNITSFINLPDDKTVILGDSYGNIIFYDVIANKALSSEKIHSSAIKKLVLIKEQNLLFSLSSYGEINLKKLEFDFNFFSEPIRHYLSHIGIVSQNSYLKSTLHTDIAKKIIHINNLNPESLVPGSYPPTINHYFPSDIFQLEKPFRLLANVTCINYSNNIIIELHVNPLIPSQFQLNGLIQPILQYNYIKIIKAFEKLSISSNLLLSNKLEQNITIIPIFSNRCRKDDGVKLFDLIDTDTKEIKLFSKIFLSSYFNNIINFNSEIKICPILISIIQNTNLCYPNNLQSQANIEKKIAIKKINIISKVIPFGKFSVDIGFTNLQQLLIPSLLNNTFTRNTLHSPVNFQFSHLSEKSQVTPSNLLKYNIVPFVVFSDVQVASIPKPQLEFNLLDNADISIKIYDPFNNIRIQSDNCNIEFIIDGRILPTFDNDLFQIPIFETIRITITDRYARRKSTDFSGISEFHPFLLFIDKGKRKIDNPKDIKKDFILITSKNNRLLPENCFRNCGRVTNWENYYFYEIPYEKSIIYAIRTDEGRIIPIANDIGILSELQGGNVCENLPITNKDKIYCKAPDLIIQSIPEIINELNIEVKFRNQIKFPNAVEKLSLINGFQYIVPLSDLLDPQEAGIYSIVIQNKKNNFKICHSFILVPELKIEVEDNDILFYPWNDDKLNVSFKIEGPTRINKAQEIGVRCFRYKSNKTFLRGNTEYKINLILDYSIYSFEIELLIPVILSKFIFNTEVNIIDQFIETSDFEKLVSIFPSGEKSLKRELPKELFDFDNLNLSIQLFIPWYLKYDHYNLFVSCSDDASIHFQDYNRFKLKMSDNNYVIREYNLYIFKPTIDTNYSLFPLTLNYEGINKDRKSVAKLCSIVSWNLHDFDISIDNNEITAQWKESCLLKHDSHVTISHNNFKNEEFYPISQKDAIGKIIVPFNERSEIQSVSLRYEISFDNHVIDSIIIDNIDASSDISLLKSYLKMNHVNGAMKVLAKLPDDIKTYYEAHIYGLFLGDYSRAKTILSNKINPPMNLGDENWFLSYLYYSLLDSQNMDINDQKSEEILKNIIAQNPDNKIALLLYAVYLSTSGPLTVVNILEILNHINQEYYLPTHYLIEGESKLHLCQFGFEVNMMKTAETVKSGLIKYPYIQQYWKLIFKLLLQMDNNNSQSIPLIISHILSSQEKMITSKIEEALGMYVSQI